MTGRSADAETAAAHVATLAGLPVAVVTATSMFADGEIFAAEQMIRRFLLEHGDHVEGMRLLAKIGMKFGVLDDAELLLRAVLQLAPDYRAARYRLCPGTARQPASPSRRARSSTNCSSEEPQNVSYRTAYATALRATRPGGAGR